VIEITFHHKKQGTTTEEHKREKNSNESKATMAELKRHQDEGTMAAWREGKAATVERYNSGLQLGNSKGVRKRALYQYIFNK
jgi:hypothetical protein